MSCLGSSLASSIPRRGVARSATGRPPRTVVSSASLPPQVRFVSKLRVSSFAVSIDGFGAGPNQDLENPLGVGGVALMDWFFPTRTWQRMHGTDDGERGID